MTDPFWTEVRRQLPDVDLVILPPEASVLAHREARPADQADAGAAVATALRVAWSALAVDAARPDHLTLGWVDPGDGSDVVHAEASARAPSAGSAATRIDPAASFLAEHGWQLDRRDPRAAGYARLIARPHGIEAEVYLMPETTVVWMRDRVGVHRDGLLTASDLAPTEQPW